MWEEASPHYGRLKQCRDGILAGFEEGSVCPAACRV